MTLDEFRKFLTATEPPAGLAHALAGLWWNGKGDWKHTNPRSRTKAGTARGYTPTCTARKATKATRRIGTIAQASPFAENRLMRSGPTS